MTYCEGGDVHSHIPPDGLREADIAWEWMLGAARALRDIHAQRIVHFDVKPQNLMLRRAHAAAEAYVVQLADFGLARELPRAAAENDEDLVLVPPHHGTPLYMAPETPVDAPARRPFGACDVWALGMTCYQLAFGRLPWTHDSPPLWHWPVSNLDFDMYDLDAALARAPPQQRSNHGPWVEGLLRRLLHPDPRARTTMANIVRWMEMREEAGVKAASDDRDRSGTPAPAPRAANATRASSAAAAPPPLALRLSLDGVTTTALEFDVLSSRDALRTAARAFVAAHSNRLVGGGCVRDDVADGKGDGAADECVARVLVDRAEAIQRAAAAAAGDEHKL